MAGFPVGTQAGAIKPADAKALMQKIRLSSAPTNPTTPNFRKDLNDERSSYCNSAKVALEKAMTTLDDHDFVLKTVMTAVLAAVLGIRNGNDPGSILSGLAATVGSANAPAMPMPQGLTAGAPPQAPPPGMPGPAPQAGPPVTPGPPGQ